MQGKLILHVGFFKTTTSSIQQTLSRNRKLFEKQRIHYPEIVRPPSQEPINHGEILASLFSDKPEALPENIKSGADIGVVNAAYLEQFEKLLARKDCTVIISAEGMEIARREFFEKIRDIFQHYGWSIEVVATVRSPLSAMIGNYSERVRDDLVSSDTPHYRLLIATLRRLEILQLVFDTVRTYPFSKACLHTRGPVGYFLDFLGIENAGAFEIVTADESLSNNAVRLLAYINRFEPAILNGKKNPRRSCGDLKAFWSIPGPDFRLTCEEYETIRERIEFENGRLENDLGREYCDDTMKLRLSDVHWDEDSLQAVRKFLPEVPSVLVPCVHKYFEEEQGLVLTHGTKF